MNNDGKMGSCSGHKPVRLGMLSMVLLLVTFHTECVRSLKIGVVIGVNQPHRVVTAFRDGIQYTNQHAPSDRYKVTPTTTRVLDNDTFNVTNDACGQLSSGAAVIVSPDGGTVHEALEAISAKLHLPLLSTSVRRVSSFQGTRYGLTLRPHEHGAIAALIQHLRWPRVYYIYDSTEGLDRLQEVLAALPTDYGLQVQYVRRVRGERAAVDFLQQRENEEWDTEKFILLDCSLETARRVVQHAHAKRRAYYTFLYLRYTLPGYWQDIQAYDATKVIALKILQEDADSHHSAVKAASQDSYYSSTESLTEEEALAYDAASVLSDAMVRLARERPELSMELFQDVPSDQGWQCYNTPLTPYKHGPVIAETLKKTSVNGTTGQIKFDEHGQRVDYTIEILQLTSHHKMQKMGYWTQQSGFVEQEEPRGYHPTRVDPIPRKIIVTTILEPPFMMFKNPNDTSESEDNLEGYCKDLIDKIMTSIGHEYSIRLVKDRKYGAKDASVQSGWNGMIGEILRKDADIAIAPLTITAERSKVVYFTEPFMTAGYAVVMKKDDKDPISVFTVFSFLRPLSWEIWLCLLGAYVAVAIVLLVVNRVNLAVATPPCQPPGTCSHLYNSLWYSLGAFMAEECNNCRPKSVGSRIISCGWWFFILVMLSMYTAQLWVNQPFSSPVGKFRDIKDLAMQDKVEYGLVKDSSLEDFFKRTRDPVYSRMWESMALFNNTMVASNDEGILRVRESGGNYALVLGSRKADYSTLQAPCDLNRLGETFQNAGYGIAMSHKFPMRKTLDVTVGRLQEDEYLSMLENKWLKKEECLQPKTSSSIEPLEVIKVGGWFVLLGAGLLIAVAVAIAEVWCKKPKKAKKPKKPKEPKEPKPKKEKKEKGGEKIKEEGVETQLLQSGNPVRGIYEHGGGDSGYPGGADETIEEVGEEDEDDMVKVPIADVENLTDSVDDTKDITRELTADRIVPLAVNPLENHPEIKSIDHSPVESPKGGYESSEV